ncbi:THO complex subunit 3-like [Gracilinanus agilis]|uniref:THO complex subunit 3-like n=1 Tax=Gracilinanus agilis TaxID=191870 RepID=UPI001CFD9331|nr:THO complex subunit 3-like [Gracilinanus agilis]
MVLQLLPSTPANSPRVSHCACAQQHSATSPAPPLLLQYRCWGPLLGSSRPTRHQGGGPCPSQQPTPPQQRLAESLPKARSLSSSFMAGWRHDDGPSAYMFEMQKRFRDHGKTIEYQQHSAAVLSVAWSCNGARLASGSLDNTAGVFLLEDDGLVKESSYQGHTDSIDQLCWHPSNPDLFVTASGDRSVRIWDVRQKRCVGNIRTKGENMNICWSPDGLTIAVGNRNDVITFIDARTHRVKAEEHFKYEVNEISWNNENNLFFLTNGNGFITILSYPELKPVQSLNAHPSNCICIEFDPTGTYFATGSADSLVSLWDLNEMVCVRCLSRLDWPVRTLSFSHDGKMIASASEDHFIDIAEVETGNKVWDIQCQSPTFTVAWHPKFPLLAFACDDKGGEPGECRETGIVKLFGLPNDSTGN